ncbi:MAG TPA: methyltransferase [Spongiibacteraceae bacterium]|nr:methyltransferase [Spongiibacteraceae bacterium]
MTDLALARLLPALRQPDRPTLWLVDENIDAAEIAALPPAPGLEALTNRYDTHLALRARGIAATLADFPAEAFAPGRYQRIVYRVSKEKALVHWLINQSLAALAEGGELWLAGFKQEGIKTYADKASALVSAPRDLDKGPGAAWLGRVQVQRAPDERLDDSDYPRLRCIDEPLDLWSKPGIFGWRKFDTGSMFLIEHLSVLRDAVTPRRVVDLGCGYGYLSVAAARELGDASVEWLATDNNCAALAACRENFRRHGLGDKVVADDAGAQLREPCDWVLCNPPFHQGFAVDVALVERFLATAARLLTPAGRALFVVNQFLPLEQRAEAHFARVEVVARNTSFKLVMLGNPG